MYASAFYRLSWLSDCFYWLIKVLGGRIHGSKMVRRSFMRSIVVRFRAKCI